MLKKSATEKPKNIDNHFRLKTTLNEKTKKHAEIEFLKQDTFVFSKTFDLQTYPFFVLINKLFSIKSLINQSLKSDFPEIKPETEPV